MRSHTAQDDIILTSPTPLAQTGTSHVSPSRFSRFSGLTTFLTRLYLATVSRSRGCVPERGSRFSLSLHCDNVIVQMGMLTFISSFTVTSSANRTGR